MGGENMTRNTMDVCNGKPFDLDEAVNHEYHEDRARQKGTHLTGSQLSQERCWKSLAPQNQAVAVADHVYVC
jgi:hypothetical protein